MVVAVVNYSLDQAQRDISQLRGQLAHGLASSEFLSVKVDTSFTAPDGTVWTTSGGMVKDTWHTVTVDAGWTNANAFQYRLTPWHTVQIFGSATHAAFTAGTNLNSSNALPAAYRPTKTWNIGGVGFPARAGAEITSAGVIVAEANGVSCTECDLAGEYPIIDI